ncbi:MAG: glutamate racemase, partial [Candidatus Kapaibacteriota bacterium]
IIGTRATIGSHAYEIAIGEYAASMKKDVEVFSKACPLFVPLAEEDFGEHPASELIAQEYLQEFLDKKIDTLVLGCTHYPLLKDLILRTLPGISLVDCGESATNELSTILNIKRQSIMDGIPSVRLFTTDTAQSFSSIAKRCIGLNLPEPIRISQETLDEQGLSGL